MQQTAPMSSTPSTLATVLRVTSGNFLEMFDFFLYGFYATYIAATFFPSHNEYASLMLTFVTFGAGFLMRPLGAVILGAYIELWRHTFANQRWLTCVRHVRAVVSLCAP